MRGEELLRESSDLEPENVTKYLFLLVKKTKSCWRKSAHTGTFVASVIDVKDKRPTPIRNSNPPSAIGRIQQRTLARSFSITGTGLHSGEPASVTIRPALPNTRIQFVRGDLPGNPSIAATFDSVVQTQLATSIGTQYFGKLIKISTVEHLLSAFCLMGVDNAIVEVHGPEIPIMDGSAERFCVAIREAGIYEQSTPRKVLVVKKRIEVRKDDKMAAIEPSMQLTIRAEIEWKHPMIGRQGFAFCLDQQDPADIASARTFGFLKDVEQLQKLGLARGGSLDNAVVLDDTSVLNPGGLRYPDEFVRHKVLDAIGDFALAPVSILGNIALVKAGHELHAELVNAIFANPNHYEIRSIDSFQESPLSLNAEDWLAPVTQGS